MNIFRVCGDLLHLASIFILLHKVYSLKKCQGLSLKTQVLYVIVFLTRYVDLLWNFSSMYNWFMKIFFIASSVATVYLMGFHRPHCETYQKSIDNFNLFYLIGPSALLSLFWNEGFSFAEILWAFSIYLEAVAIIPQLVVVQNNAKQQAGFVEALTGHYVFSLGGYRAMYLINWIYRLVTEDYYRHWIVWIAGTVQTAIYCDFFYYYIKARWENTHIHLPV